MFLSQLDYKVIKHINIVKKHGLIVIVVRVCSGSGKQVLRNLLTHNRASVHTINVKDADCFGTAFTSDVTSQLFSWERGGA